MFGHSVLPRTAALMDQQVVGAPPGWTVKRAMETIIPSESGGDPTAANPKSSARGIAQYITRTWQQFAPRYGVDITKYPTADKAPPEIQIDVFANTLLDRNGGGVGHWTVGNSKVANTIFGPMRNDMPAVVASLKTNNPDSFIQVAEQLAPGRPNLEGWGNAFAVLAAPFLARGETDKVAAIEDTMLRVAHAGTNMHLMGAYASLQKGDTVTAGAQLAQAYKFMPDGGAAKFYKGPNDQLFVQKVDEKTGSPISKMMPVTPEGVAAQMQFTRNPVTFIKTLNEMQKNTAEVRLREAQTAHAYAQAGQSLGANQARIDAAQIAAQQRAQTGAQRTAGIVEAARIRAGAQGQGKEPTPSQAAQMVDNVFKEHQLAANTPEKQQLLATRRNLTRELLYGSGYQLDPYAARVQADDLLGGRLDAVGPATDNKTGQRIWIIVNKNNQPVNKVSGSVGDLLAQQKKQTAIPASR